MNWVLITMSFIWAGSFLLVIVFFHVRNRALRLNGLLEVNNQSIVFYADVKWSLAMLVEHEHFLRLLLTVELKDVEVIFDHLMGLSVAFFVKILGVRVDLVLHHRHFWSVIKFRDGLELSIACWPQRHWLSVFNELSDAKDSDHGHVLDENQDGYEKWYNLNSSPSSLLVVRNLNYYLGDGFKHELDSYLDPEAVLKVE